MLLNEQQQLLKTTVEDLLRQQSPVSALRHLRDNQDATGYSKQLWQQLVDMGIPTAALPEQFGGYGFGYLGLGAVFEVMGQSLCATPLLSSIVLGASVMELSGDETLQSSLLPNILEGKTTVALAIDEANRHQPLGIECSAQQRGDQWLLQGRKTFVLDGHSADKIIVVARTSPASAANAARGLTLFLIDAKTKGLTIERTHMMDGRNAANLQFNNLYTDNSAIIGSFDKGWAILQPVLNRGRICLAAEMLGGATAVFEQTMAYLREREQFDVKIGSFQALKHRSAQLLCDLELCRSSVMAALDALDKDPKSTSQLACLAKTLANDVYLKATNEAVQLHGGMGVTDELDVGLFLKRARVCIQTLGDSHYLQDQYARLSGF